MGENLSPQRTLEKAEPDEPDTKPNPGKQSFAGPKLEAESLFLSPYYPDSYIFPWNPDSLVRNNNYTIYDEMKDDDQVKVAMSLKKDMVSRSLASSNV